MKSHIIVAIVGLIAASTVAFSGCGGSTQKIAPDARGQRGESCQSRNDCAAGLACIGQICAKNEFNIAPQAKVCEEVDCASTADCCGDRPTSLPAECKNYQSVCLTPQIPNCIATTCTSVADCNGGACGNGYCSNYTGKSCAGDGDCIDHCVAGSCSVYPLSCTLDTDCLYDTTPGTCTTRYCNCANPAYNPSDPLCTNTNCVDVCDQVCTQERCVPNSACTGSDDCLFSDPTRPICSAGNCVECVVDTDCLTEGDKCVDNACKKPCEVNEECPLFEACDVPTGKCVYQGCTTDAQCVLWLSQISDGTDARLAKCLQSDDDATKKVCKVPCENDANCREQEVCQAGYCKFIGCTTDEECRGYLNLADETTSDTRPYIPKAVCRLPTPSTP